MLLGRFQISGHSMLPTFAPGQTVLVSAFPYLFAKPHIGDIVVFQDLNDTIHYVKRIQRIEKNRYFLVGDNPKDSRDSREFGWIEKKDIIGKVLRKL